MTRARRAAARRRPFFRLAAGEISPTLHRNFLPGAVYLTLWQSMRNDVSTRH